jgi:hypothetical protein
MAITQRGSAVTGPGNSSSTTLTLTKPTGVVSGDLLVAVVSAIGSGSTITGPSGWTEIDTSTSAGGLKASLWAKIAGGSEPANYAWNETALGSQRWVGTLTAWQGVDTSSLANAINTATEHDVTSNQTTSTTQSTPTLASSAVSIGRVFYSRTCRVASATPISFSSLGAGFTELSDHGNNSGGSISYSHIAALADTDFSGAGSKSGLSTTASTNPTDNVLMTWVIKAAGTPASGDISTSIDVPTVAFNGSRVMPDGPLSTSIDVPTVAFTGVATPPSGSISTSIDVPTVTFNAVVAAGGPLSTSIDVPAFSGVGAVNPIGAFSTSIDVPTVAFVGETVPFGEHVIVVEAEHRAFRVLDDEPGLIPIKRSQVSNL